MTARWRKLRRLFIHKVLHANDTPHCIALGVAIGIFVGFTPTIGFQTFIAIAVAAAFGANKLATVPMVWITNIVTAPPIYWLCHRIGAGLVGSSKDAVDPVAALPAFEWARMLEFEYWVSVASSVTLFGAELWAGCVLVGFITGTICYFVSRWLVTDYRRRRASHLEARAERQSRRQFTKGIRARRPVA